MLYISTRAATGQAEPKRFCEILLEGLAPDPLLAGLQRVWGDGLYRMALLADSVASLSESPIASGVVSASAPSASASASAALAFSPQLHACADAAQEAQRLVKV